MVISNAKYSRKQQGAKNRGYLSMQFGEIEFSNTQTRPHYFDNPHYEQLTYLRLEGYEE